MLNFLVQRFAFVILLACLLSFIYPPLFIWFNGNFITAGLGIIMFSMGIQLSPEDFKRVAKNPAAVFLGVFLQYFCMPLTGYFTAKAFDLPPDLAIGLILVACCPGGTASNVISYLAKADVALSVTMTSISTFLAILLTPLLTSFYAGNRVNVPEMGLFISTLKVVLFPVSAGLLFHKYSKKYEKIINDVFPAIAVIFITLIVASIVGAGREEIIANGFILPLAVLTLHGFGFLSGYIFSRLLLKSVLFSRTISIEVGMQNSGLGVVLARQNFIHPATAIPSAISSLFHSLIGSFLAAFWQKETPKS